MWSLLKGRNGRIGATGRVAATLGMAVLALAAAPAATPAAAQTPQPLEPAADFRTAPLIGDGTYSVDLVAGERVWVSVHYTNYAGFSISADLTDVDVGTNDELTLYRAIVAPNLNATAIETEDISSPEGSGMSWSGGETDTNLWFLAFTLETTGQAGIPHTLEFTLEGFEDVGSNEPCGDDCTLDEDLATLEEEIAELEGEVEECGEACSNPPSQADLESERDALLADVDAEESAITDLCGGELCDSLPAKSNIPWLPVTLLAVAAVIAAGGLVRALARRKAATR